MSEDFPEPETPVTQIRSIQWDRHVDIFQIVMLRADDFNLGIALRAVFSALRFFVFPLR